MRTPALLLLLFASISIVSVLLLTFSSSLAIASRPEATEWLMRGKKLRHLDDTVEVGDKKYNKTACFLEAVRADPNFFFGWFNLALTMERPDDKVYVDVGKSVPAKWYTKIDCLLECLRCDPKNFRGWHNLARSLTDNAGETVEYKGKKLNQVDLYKRAIKLEPDFFHSWYELASLLHRGESIKLRGQVYTQQELFVEALKRDSSHSFAWTDLGNSLAGDATVMLNGKSYSKEDCEVAAQEARMK